VEQSAEALDISVVQRCFDFIQNADGNRIIGEGAGLTFWRVRIGAGGSVPAFSNSNSCATSIAPDSSVPYAGKSLIRCSMRSGSALISFVCADGGKGKASIAMKNIVRRNMNLSPNFRSTPITAVTMVENGGAGNEQHH